MKRILSLVLSLVMLAALVAVPTAVADPNTVILTLRPVSGQPATVAAGVNVQYELHVSNPGALPISSLGFGAFNFPASLFTWDWSRTLAFEHSGTAACYDNADATTWPISRPTLANGGVGAAGVLQIMPSVTLPLNPDILFQGVADWNATGGIVARFHLTTVASVTLAEANIGFSVENNGVSSVGNVRHPFSLVNQTVAVLTDGHLITFAASPATGGTVNVSLSDGPIPLQTLSNNSYVPNGASLVLTAAANPRYEFYRWTVNGSASSTSPWINYVPVTEASHFIAIFQPLLYPVEITNGGTGASVSSGPYGSSRQQGDTVTIYAGTRDDYVFNGWTTSDDITFSSAYHSTTTFVMPASAVTVSINWRAADVPCEECGNLDCTCIHLCSNCLNAVCTCIPLAQPRGCVDGIDYRNDILVYGFEDNFSIIDDKRVVSLSAREKQTAYFAKVFAAGAGTPPASPSPFAINLTKDRLELTDSFAPALFSVDGGKKWRAVKGEQLTTKFGKMLNKGLTLHLADKAEGKVPAVDARVIQFQQIGARPKIGKFSVNYGIFADATGVTPGGWAISTKENVKKPTKDLKVGDALTIGWQVGIGPADVPKAKTVDVNGFGYFCRIADCTVCRGRGISVKSLGDETKPIRTPYFFRSEARMTVSATGITYVAGSRAKRANILSELKLTKYGVKVKGDAHNLKVKANTFVSINGGAPTLYNKETIDLAKITPTPTTVVVWQQATGKRPVTKKQPVDLPTG
jgi:hypothetical protein